MAGCEHEVRKRESNHCFDIFDRSSMLNLKQKYTERSICDINLVSKMQFSQRNAAFFRWESKLLNYQVKYRFCRYPSINSILLEDQTATEISYQSYAACY